MVDVGARLRHFRQQHGLTQRMLAQRSGINPSTISLIEKNRTSPSVGVLKRILDGIPISISAFFTDGVANQQDDFAFKSDELLELARGPITLRQVGGDLTGKALQIMYERFEPGADTGSTFLRHEAEEGGFVLAGEIELTVGDKSVVLTTGDAYYFDSRRPHRFRNLSDAPAELISACSPPSF